MQTHRSYRMNSVLMYSNYSYISLLAHCGQAKQNKLVTSSAEIEF
jgi:hypothetical protein